MAWFDENGRKHLPWQQDRTTYRVWVSEIMLQQTQVATVIPYYERFMRRFPKLQVLADAAEDEVLLHWSGLGYYARARNLHRCAKQAVREYDGALPEDIESLMDMPGIGRSTAAAILSLAKDRPYAILDGNVKRVLCRHQAIDGWPGKQAVLNELWTLSEALTPQKRTADYNQGMMDLGATVCTRTRPDCSRCPLSTDCQGLAMGDPAAFPRRRVKKANPTRHTCMLLLTLADSGVDAAASGATLLQRRPATGVWARLWSLPEVGSAAEVDTWLHTAGLKAVTGPDISIRFRHTFSHFHLDIEVVEMDVERLQCKVMECNERVWYNGGRLPGGIAAPVNRILENRFGDPS